MLDTRIGEIIKQIRKSKKMTLQDLSESTALSISYLSMLERGLNSPTIANLQKICQSIGITFNELLSNLDNEQRIYIPKDGRRVIFEDEDDSVLYEAITEGNHQIKGICMTIFDMGEHESARHVADELGFVVSGHMKMIVDGIEYQLNPLDSLYIPAQSLHSFQKTSEEPCVSIWSCHNVSMDNEGYPV